MGKRRGGEDGRFWRSSASGSGYGSGTGRVYGFGRSSGKPRSDNLSWRKMDSRLSGRRIEDGEGGNNPSKTQEKSKGSVHQNMLTFEREVGDDGKAFDGGETMEAGKVAAAMEVDLTKAGDGKSEVKMVKEKIKERRLLSLRVVT